MTTALETIPVDEEGATLLHKQPRSTGIRRVVLGAALASFVIGVLAPTAVRTSPGPRHASNLHSKHKHETTEVDDEGPHPYFWDDDDFPDDGIETEACDRKCTTDADCATEFPEFNECGHCQNWGKNPSMECDRGTRPVAPPNTPSLTIKDAQIRLKSDPTKCITFSPAADFRIHDTLIVDKCGGGGGAGHRLSLQQFTYSYKTGNEKVNGEGRIVYDHDIIDKTNSANRCLSASLQWCNPKTGCDMILWDCKYLESNEGNLYYDGTTIRVYDNANNGDMCLTDHKGKLTMEKCKGKEGDKTQQWQIGDAPSPPPSGACNKACPSGKDSECSWLGGDNSCTKCDTTSGARFMCVAP